MITYEKLFKAVTGCKEFAAKNDPRSYLCGVHIVSTDAGLRIEASDGHTAVRFVSESRAEGDDVDVILDRANVDLLLQTIKLKQINKNSRTGPVRFSAEDSGVRLDCGFSAEDSGVRLDCGFSAKCAEGRFPELDRVFWRQKDRKPVESFGVSAEYLARLLKVAGKGKGVQLSFKDVASSMRVDFPGVLEGFTVEALVMAYRL